MLEARVVERVIRMLRRDLGVLGLLGLLCTKEMESFGSRELGVQLRVLAQGT